MAIAERLAKADPDNAGWQRDLSVSHDRIGDVQVAQGDLSGALESYRASMAIAERLAKADPDNAGWQADLAASHGKLGQLMSRMGERDKALELFRQGRALVAPLAERSGHALWKQYLATFDAEIAALGN
ncbi:MAG TPA: tetratricopeptide repeat protein [Rhodospirillaceae bacterium]|nr:tetratricopeptide repeat protein [Rhodospirillaceae bacterium]